LVSDMAARHERSPLFGNRSITEPVTTVRPAQFERNAGELDAQLKAHLQSTQ
jgi:hypothetical protein